MEIMDSVQIDDRMKEFPFPVHKYISCIVVRDSQILCGSRIPQIQQALEEFFTDTNLFFNGKEWIVLYSQEQEAYDILNISYGDFSNLLASFCLEAGISYVSRLPEMLRTLYLTHPDIIRLYYYDVESNNNLLEVLFTYLFYEKSVKYTARLLYVHRNTVLNKINKIEDVLGHSLDGDSDHFLLLLSCMIIKYQHTYMNRNVKGFFGKGN